MLAAREAIVFSKLHLSNCKCSNCPNKWGEDNIIAIKHWHENRLDGNNKWFLNLLLQHMCVVLFCTHCTKVNTILKYCYSLHSLHSAKYQCAMLSSFWLTFVSYLNLAMGSSKWNLNGVICYHFNESEVEDTKYFWTPEWLAKAVSLPLPTMNKEQAHFKSTFKQCKTVSNRIGKNNYVICNASV